MCFEKKGRFQQDVSVLAFHMWLFLGGVTRGNVCTGQLNYYFADYMAVLVAFEYL